MTSMAVTSDRDASRGDDGTEDIKATDIGYPATTSKNQLLKNWNDVQEKESSTDLFVVFSTYQSIEVIGKAQKEGFPEFDLIISDEAHRTTGAHEMNKDASVFTKVHDNENVKGKLRMYQTATPKIYGDSAKKNAKDKSILLSSMDDESKYGEVIYRMGFGQAVSRGILTDYKVMVLAVDETAIQRDMQRTLADPENGLNIDDVGRIIGIWNGMMRRNGYKNPIKNSPYDGAPLERAIAFTRTIEDSKKVSHQFEEVVNEYIGADIEEQSKKLSMRHADGTMNALQKGEVLDWLADPNKPSDEARIVSNVRFLTEGIDVPTLDAVIFLAPKKSQVDIVQAVGRIMRKSENKDYGYIILPIVIPAGEKPETILDNNKHYEAVWQIINALRSVDERFEAMVDKINIAKPKQLKVIGVGSAPDKENDLEDNITDTNTPKSKEFEHTQLEFQWDKYEKAIFGKIVEKVGNRKYLENWSADVAKIAQRQISWIKTKLEDKNDPISIEFKKFVSSLQHNINESIDENQAAEMLSQHLITKPIFEALFSEYSFVNNNPVSSAMENIVQELEKAGFAKEQENLAPLYESVKMRADGVEKAEDKQKIIVTLYEKFFSTAFNSTAKRLGIVFTPIEIVDFIVKSVDDTLKNHFGKSLASEGVHILDPFTGTGTFIVRTLEYLKEQMKTGEISLADITRKFSQELHANEIVLLSYYIAAINIEATFDEINGDEEGYLPFEGIVLTDTFESTENKRTLIDEYLGSNDDRLKRQQEVPITAIIGNPPYSVGRKNANDDSIKTEYIKLNKNIFETYSSDSSSKLKKAMYDSYIQAFRWASNEIKDNGIVAFITNGSFVDTQSLNGMRKALFEEFNYIYIYNLRGDQRTSGEQSRREGGKIFGSGSRTQIAITLLIKDESDNHEIFYKDIGDYLTREEKLKILSENGSITNVDWIKIQPDTNNDWINHRNSEYQKFDSIEESYFNIKSVGVSTSRDSWVYSFSASELMVNVSRLIDNYNNELNSKKLYEEVSKSEDYIKWSDKLTKLYKKGKKLELNTESIRISMYRPFTKKFIYYQNDLIERPGNLQKYYSENNKMIVVSGKNSKKDFSVLMVNVLPNYDLMEKTQSFLLELGETRQDFYIDNYNISDEITEKLGITKRDVFYYVYALLHNKQFQDKYSNDLKKDLPKIPLVKNIKRYVEIGKELADLHLNYECHKKDDNILVEKSKGYNYQVKKMVFGKKVNNKGKSTIDKTVIIFNDYIKIKNIPEFAYDYILNGKPAINWIMEQYCVSRNKNTGIIENPNLFSEDPKYILNLLLSVITLSIKTIKLVEELPSFE